MRVAVTQFATSLNADENLATCIRMLNNAAVCEPSLIVLPELCNTQFCSQTFSSTQPCYIDHNKTWNEALPINGPFLQGIAEEAKKHNCYIVINVTLRRDVSRDHENSAIKSNISITSCLFSPLGELIQQVDKQTLIGYENDFFISLNNTSEAITTPFGTLGLLVGHDDITFETSRDLALSGAQLLCHSLNSFALDQSCLHGPARACENKVFLVSANKVGSLVPEVHIYDEDIKERNHFEDHIPQRYLVGAGQSQIISPSGRVLAKISHNHEGFVFADISLEETSNKFRPDGTELITQRRPELYQALTAPSSLLGANVNNNDIHDSELDESKVPATANVAIFATYKSNEQAIDDVCHYIENNLSDIIQLPELFFIADKSILNNTEKRAKIECLSQLLIKQIRAELRPFQYVCTSLIIEGVHQAVIISDQGVFATQQQLHFCERYQWTALGDDLNIIVLPLEQGNIKVAMLTADDANIPEIVNVSALSHIHVLLVPFDIQEPCEVEYSLLSRAAEHRIFIVAASREKNFANDALNNVTYELTNEDPNKNMFKKNKVKLHKSTGFIANLTTGFSQHSTFIYPQLSQWKSRKFNGYINQPLVKHQHGKITKAVIHPIAAC